MNNPFNGFQPYNEQEAQDLALMSQGWCKEALLRTHPNYHFTTSAWIVNKTHTKVLMAYHEIYQSYAWLGGHNDGDEDFLRVCLKEIHEESGLTQVKVLSELPFSVEVLSVQGHIKDGRYVPSHLHYNVTYLIEADEKEPISTVYNLKWIEIKDLGSRVQETWMNEHVYTKLNEKLERWDACV